MLPGENSIVFQFLKSTVNRFERKHGVPSACSRLCRAVPQHRAALRYKPTQTGVCWSSLQPGPRTAPHWHAGGEAVTYNQRFILLAVFVIVIEHVCTIPVYRISITATILFVHLFT